MTTPTVVPQPDKLSSQMISDSTQFSQIKEPLTLFLIGATGDLSRHKILKALYTLFQQGLLPEMFRLVGNARATYSKQEFHDFIRSIIKPTDEKVWHKFCQGVEYVSGDVTDPETFQKLKEWHDSTQYCGNHLWYIATLPSLYVDIIQHLHHFNFHRNDCGWTKCMLEKPFGTDVESAQKLDKELLNVFSEQQIYRIDHFLAKETVQNILAFRFANGIFEHLWNRHFIDHIQIHSTEIIGIEGREIFYDATGTLRDVVQNHVLHLLATTLMEQPATLQPADIRSKRSELLTQLQPLDESDLQNQVAFGQYGTGKVGSETVSGYLSEKRIPANSQTETAVALKCFINSARWEGVPIYIKAGKRLHETVTEISIHFKERQNSMFSAADVKQNPNILTLRIGPHEGVEIRLHVKKPGIKLELQEVPIKFYYENTFQMDLVEAYVKLIYDAVQGDPTLFPDAKGIESCWQFIQPLLKAKADASFQPDTYPAGSDGPPSFEELIARDGREWYVSQSS